MNLTCSIPGSCKPISNSNISFICLTNMRRQHLYLVRRNPTYFFSPFWSFIYQMFFKRNPVVSMLFHIVNISKSIAKKHMHYSRGNSTVCSWFNEHQLISYFRRWTFVSIDYNKASPSIFSGFCNMRHYIYLG